MAWLAAGISAASGMGTSAYAGAQQAAATQRASRLAAQTGQETASGIKDAYGRGTGYQAAGNAGAMGQYNQALQYAQQQRESLAPMFATARGVGQSALARYQDAVLRGNQGAVYSDPSFSMRMGAGANAAANIARTAGMSPAQMQSAGQYNRRLADSEYAAAMARLQGLGAIGTQATNAYAGLNQGATDAINRAYGARAGQQFGYGQQQALSRADMARNYAAALSGMGANVNEYNIMGANALAQQQANAYAQQQQAVANALYLQELQRVRNPPPTRESVSISPAGGVRSDGIKTHIPYYREESGNYFGNPSGYGATPVSPYGEWG